MNLINLLCPLLLFFTTSPNSEELPSLQIAELSALSSHVLEAKFLKAQDGTYIFLTKNIESQGDFTDTLALEYLDGVYGESVADGTGLKNSEKVIIYISDLEGMEGGVTFSGFRILKDNKIYAPIQLDNPGGYTFTAKSERVTWSAFKERIIKVHHRISAIKAMNNIEDPVQRNRELFHWIEASKSTFYQSCDFDADCGWGLIDSHVFDWISSGNIAEDTWKASQVYRAINANSAIDWRNGMGFIHDENGSSFTTYEEIDFLVNIATNEKQPIEERRQALVFLSPAAGKVYEKNDPVLDSTYLAFQIKKQKSIKKAAFELMQDSVLKYDAFNVVVRLTNPYSYGDRHRTDHSHLPEIVELYQKEEPSSYRTGLARYIARNSTVEEWRKLTGCDANIYVNLSHLEVDTLRNKFSFSIYYAYGREVMNDLPIVVIRSLTDGKEYIFSEQLEFNLPWHGGSRYVRMDLKTMGLEKGDYEFYVKGKAGEEGDKKWKTGVVRFSF